jgi:hypothetical protein
MSPALRPTPNLEYRVSVFTYMSHSDREAQLYPQAPDSLFVAFYNSQDYNGGIRTRLHKDVWTYFPNQSLLPCLGLTGICHLLSNIACNIVTIVLTIDGVRIGNRIY